MLIVARFCKFCFFKTNDISLRSYRRGHLDSAVSYTYLHLLTNSGIQPTREAACSFFECNFVYYGQTDRALETSLKEHKRAVRDGDNNSKVAQHANQFVHSVMVYK